MYQQKRTLSFEEEKEEKEKKDIYIDSKGHVRVGNIISKEKVTAFELDMWAMEGCEGAET